VVVPASLSLGLFADASNAANVMHAFVAPVMATLCIIASLACTFFLVSGGIQYITSSGDPDKLQQAKKILKNALIGLAIVIAAATLTAILSHAYGATASTTANKLPRLQPIQANHSGNFWDVITKAIITVLQSIVQSIGQPFVQALSYFTNRTPLMGDNSNVFNMWLAIVGITDILFVLVVGLLGFEVMSFSVLGLEEINIRQMLPQLALVFLLVNSSIFAIDGVISLSNAMIHALQSAFPSASVWDLLGQVIKQSNNLGLAGLLILISFLVLTVMLLVYYIGRLITLYIGAILSPLIFLLWLLPAFKDFAITAAKIYFTTIFVLFVQVVIMQLASSMFITMLQGGTNSQPNTLMALLVGTATVWALLKTQGVMKELSYAASTPRAAREMAGTFVRGVSFMNQTRKNTIKTSQGTYKQAVKANNYIKKKRRTSIDRSKGSSAGDRTIRTKSVTGEPLRTGETRSVSAAGPGDVSFSAEELGLTFSSSKEEKK